MPRNVLNGFLIENYSLCILSKLLMSLKLIFFWFLDYCLTKQKQCLQILLQTKLRIYIFYVLFLRLISSEVLSESFLLNSICIKNISFFVSISKRFEEDFLCH